MGNSTSKAAKQAASGAARKYPSRAAPPVSAHRAAEPPSQHAPGPTVHPEPYATEIRDKTVDQDASDPTFARSLRSLGAVQPADIQTPASRYGEVLADKARLGGGAIDVAPGGPPVMPDHASNPAIRILTARQAWQDLADREAGEIGRRGFAGRELIDVTTLRQVLSMRDRGKADKDIEELLDLKSGIVARLGRRGMIEATEVGRD